MSKLTLTLLLILAVAAVALADVCLKKAAQSGGTLAQAFLSPWMALAIGLYLFQIFFFTYLFVAGWQLSIIGNLQTVFYALVVLSFGVFYFHETLTAVQVAGICLALIEVYLINTPV